MFLDWLSLVFLRPFSQVLRNSLPLWQLMLLHSVSLHSLQRGRCLRAIMGLGTSASELQPGGHSEAADPGLQVVEPPLIGRPTVIAPKDLLQQLETIGSLGGQG